MNELLASIRADLTDRRLLPVVGLVVVCLVAAIAYAVLGGGSSSSTPGESSAPIPSVATTSGIAVTGMTPDHAVAETTDGYKEQKSGQARNPFTPLVGAATTATGAAATGAGSSKSSSPTSGTSGGSGSPTQTSHSKEEKTSGGSEPKPKSSKPTTAYDVTIDFGTLPPGVTPETAQLTQFPKLKLQTPLPSATLPILVFRGVTAKGASATFTVVGEALLSGTGSCLPSPTQCEAVDLKPGETEQLDYVNGDGSTTVYELRVLSIKAESSKAKGAKARGWAESRAGRELLQASGLMALPYLRYSTQPGVLVFAPRKASAATARIALVAPLG